MSFSTGDGPLGSPEPNWTFTSSPGSTTLTIVSGAQDYPGAWVIAPAGSNWITPYAGGGTTATSEAPLGEYDDQSGFRRSVGGRHDVQWSSDNNVKFLLNGISVSSNGSTGYGSLVSFVIPCRRIIPAQQYIFGESPKHSLRRLQQPDRAACERNCNPTAASLCTLRLRRWRTLPVRLAPDEAEAHRRVIKTARPLRRDRREAVFLYSLRMSLRQCQNKHCESYWLMSVGAQWRACSAPRRTCKAARARISWNLTPSVRAEADTGSRIFEQTGALVRTPGLEPGRDYSQGILSPLRLPFRHVRVATSPARSGGEPTRRRVH